MLNTQEIRDLENRLRRYKNKKYINLSISVFVAVVIISISAYISFFYKPDKSKKDFNTTIDKKTLPKKQIIKESNMDIHKIDKKNNTSKSSIANIEKNSTKLSIRKSHALKASKKSNYEDVLALNTDFINNIFTKTDTKEIAKKDTRNNNMNLLKKSIIKNSVTEYTGIKKQKILISSKKIDRIKYLKDRYKATRKAKYAILLSKEFYKKHNYKLSLKWAIIANDIDSTKEESWLMFAKNKVKLGQKQEAIKALRIYLRSCNSAKVENLLSDIKNGAMK